MSEGLFSLAGSGGGAGGEQRSQHLPRVVTVRVSETCSDASGC